jgi:hypothetical protein
VLDVTTGNGAILCSVLLVVVGSNSHCFGMHDRRGRCCGLCTIGGRGLSQPLWSRNVRCDRCSGLSSLGRRGSNQPLSWRERYSRALLWPLFAWSGWAKSVTAVAGTTGEGATLTSVILAGVDTADLASVRFVGVGSTSHCGGRLVRCGRCLGFCSLVQRELRQPLCWREQLLRVLLWLLLAGSAWDQLPLWWRARQVCALL